VSPHHFNYILLILRIKLLRNSLRNDPEIQNNTKNQNSEQKEIRIHNERSQQQKSNDNSENFLVYCVFISAYDNNCLYWIENKIIFIYLFIYIYRIGDSNDDTSSEEHFKNSKISRGSYLKLELFIFAHIFLILSHDPVLLDMQNLEHMFGVEFPADGHSETCILMARKPHKVKTSKHQKNPECCLSTLHRNIYMKHKYNLYT
jgi:hypothetical protein